MFFIIYIVSLFLLQLINLIPFWSSFFGYLKKYSKLCPYF